MRHPSEQGMESRLRIELFGGLRVTGPGQEMPPLRRSKVAALLAYLAFYRQRRHAREELIELLWPESDPEAGRNNLRVALHALRQHLAESGLPIDGLL